MFKVIALFILSILFLYTSAAPTFEKDINQPTTNSTKSWEAAHQLPRMVLDPTASLRESDKIVILAYRQQIDQYFNVASVAYWLYEYFLTIIPEISFIWPSRWTSVKVLYLLTRYSPFVDSGLAIPAYIISTATTEMCMNLNIAHTIFVYIGIVFAEVMLVYRVWVVWNQGQWMGCGLFVFSIISMNTAMGLTLAVLSSSEGEHYLPFRLEPLGKLVRFFQCSRTKSTARLRCRFQYTVRNSLLGIHLGIFTRPCGFNVCSVYPHLS
ncbi:hypothetical protein P691DRAFT_170475 [Macrolepiota fuliginosa MF-IS2]|uniref:DUF6533 domain-containing protein n=1 Tax=Macrolepiota fuliginosa MF-IS2 TaxID=1400762 RepID=A0A9P5XC75_9AGAR|nr:hypothetical protein P691DRAFT_170475 [Macrolepiota fuliginosa MF-IS2]